MSNCASAIVAANRAVKAPHAATSTIAPEIICGSVGVAALSTG
jgi:hypothetical protein